MRIIVAERGIWITVLAIVLLAFWIMWPAQSRVWVSNVNGVVRVCDESLHPRLLGTVAPDTIQTFVVPRP